MSAMPDGPFRIGLLVVLVLAMTGGPGPGPGPGHGPGREPEPEPDEELPAPAPWRARTLPRQLLGARPIGPLRRMPRQWGPCGPPEITFLDGPDVAP